MVQQNGVTLPAFDPKKLDVRVKWWGLKRKTIQVPEDWVALPKADLYVDCRVVPEKGIKGFSGQNLEFQAGVLAAAPETIKRIVDTVVGGLALAGDRRHDENPYAKPFTVCFFCAYGMHRSPSTALLVTERLRKLGYKVTIPAKSYQEPLTHKLPILFSPLK